MFKQISVVMMMSALFVFSTGCTQSEQPGKTQDGVSPSGENRNDSAFGYSSQISKQVANGTLNDGIVVDRPLSSAPADAADLSGTTARDNNSWNADRISNSAVGFAQEPGSDNASKAYLHAADGSSPIVASGNSVNTVAIDADRRLRASASNSGSVVRVAQVELNRRGFQLEEDGVMGLQTRSALREFQKAEGLEATGELNQTTINALNIKGFGSDTEMDRAPASIEDPEHPTNSNSY